jgi:ABC-2 type transport system permease protein
VRHVSIFFSYFGQYTKTRLAYRGDLIAQVFTSLLSTLFAFAIVFVIFEGGKIQAIGHWSKHQVYFIFGFTYIPFGLFNVLSINLYQFSQRYIIEGRFDRLLLRPLGTLPQVLFESFRLQSLTEVAIGLAVITFSARALGSPLDAVDYLLVLVMGLGGFGVLLGVFLILVSVSFWVEDKLGITPPVYNLIMLGRYPMDIYSGPLQFILKFIIPFGFIGFFPSATFIAGARFTGGLKLGCLLTPAVGALCLILAVIAWDLGVRRYSSTGH